MSDDRLFSVNDARGEPPDAASSRPASTASVTTTSDHPVEAAHGVETDERGAATEPVIEQPPPVEQLSDSIPGAVLIYGSVEDWVTRYLLVMYRRAVSGTGTTWCPQWWRHPEAVVRLEALWRAWEYLRKDATTGMSVWLRDHCDPHMTQLLSADGPFKGCKSKQHSGHPTDPLPFDPSPADWFAHTDDGDLPIAAVGQGR